ALLAQRLLLAEVVVLAMQIVDILGDHHALRVVPGAVADPVAGVHSSLAALGRRAEICAPRLVAGADRLGELLAMRVRAFEAAEICAVARTFTRNEEAHVRICFLCSRARGAEQCGDRGGEDDFRIEFHSEPPGCSSLGLSAIESILQRLHRYRLARRSGRCRFGRYGPLV